ncbi:transposase [Microbispora sp. CA-102843]|uniref:transposase n=1 Tax=Microbispora sp. CA-102843 TaxID=3239952 RepID=UPI003D8CF358
MSPPASWPGGSRPGPRGSPRPPCGTRRAGASRTLRRLSRAVSRRRGPDRRTGLRPSNRWRRADAARNRVHHRVAALRRDAIHKLTTSLAREYGTIVVEALNDRPGPATPRSIWLALSSTSPGVARRR